ncbi:hypothetical protein HPB47_015622 [Ixodes persulcatus]|uniref:Uncharacterized protein n=1 Tax=Ixodes persulcatus TaxID=34615 RepID=A0AC60QTX1_IXOPE|nr:hypothetical protein HPB47_015622 [Ixodes persulcatus]
MPKHSYQPAATTLARRPDLAVALKRRGAPPTEALPPFSLPLLSVENEGVDKVPPSQTSCRRRRRIECFPAARATSASSFHDGGTRAASRRHLLIAGCRSPINTKKEGSNRQRPENIPPTLLRLTYFSEEPRRPAGATRDSQVNAAMRAAIFVSGLWNSS